MNDLHTIAMADQQRARAIIEETRILEIWASVGATINLVGSLRMGLLIGHRDIDFHIYTAPFVLADSFVAVGRLAENPRIRSVTYANLLDAEDRCIEWHATYDDPGGDPWQLDMIHILIDSPYAGYFERVADRISAVLTEETRDAILSIKYELARGEKVMGIEVYRAVIEGGVRDVAGFRQWREQHPPDGIVIWMP